MFSCYTNTSRKKKLIASPESSLPFTVLYIKQKYGTATVISPFIEQGESTKEMKKSI
jgi:hypothetical protein